jgi:transglutaminase-like putative cysteine protease
VEEIDKKYILPTPIIDSDSQAIIEFADHTIGKTKGSIEKATKLYYAVRDGVWYDPYYPFYLPEHYRASNVLRSGRGFCISKATLLCALGRACQISSRVGFATVRNHLATKQLIEFFGSDTFVYHGFTEFFLEGKWIKATPAFNLELCRRHRVAPLEFNGRDDSIFQAYNSEKKLFMEYIEDHGGYADIPVVQILSAWRRAYGEDRVNFWIKALQKSGDNNRRDFFEEEILSD